MKDYGYCEVINEVILSLKIFTFCHKTFFGELAHENTT